MGVTEEDPADISRMLRLIIHSFEAFNIMYNCQHHEKLYDQSINILRHGNFIFLRAKIKIIHSWMEKVTTVTVKKITCDEH